jgi:hypothetical protein
MFRSTPLGAATTVAVAHEGADATDLERVLGTSRDEHLVPGSKFLALINDGAAGDEAKPIAFPV